MKNLLKKVAGGESLTREESFKMTAGIAAGASGLPPLPGAAANFAVTLALIALGGRLAGRLREAGLASRALPLSGLLLAALGALALLFGA